MGAADSTAICNLALRKIGDKKISSITDADDSLAIKCNDVYSSVLKDTLIQAKPRFAVKSAVLGHVTDSTTNITAISVDANGLITVTAASHGLATDDVVSIINVGGMTKLNGRKFTVTKVDDNDVTLQGVDGSDYDDYTSGGTIGEVSDVPSEVDFDNRYNLPSDFEVLWKINGEEANFYRPISSSDRSPLRDKKYSIEWVDSLELLTDDVTASIKYIFNVTDTTKFDDLFVQMLAWQLAAELAFTVSQSTSFADGVEAKAGRRMAMYKSIMSQSSGTPRQARQDDIVAARE